MGEAFEAEGSAKTDRAAKKLKVAAMDRRAGSPYLKHE